MFLGAGFTGCSSTARTDPSRLQRVDLAAALSHGNYSAPAPFAFVPVETEFVLAQPDL